MTLTQEQEQTRLTGLGGSDAAAALGLSPWKTPYQLWLEKRGLAVDERETARMRLGKRIEDVIAEDFAADASMQLQRVTTTLRSPDHRWMVAHIDRAVINPQIAKRVRWNGRRLTTDSILEAKLVSTWAINQWGEEGTDEVPAYYLTQGVHYLVVTGVELCHFGAWCDGRLRRYKLRRDPELIEMVVEGERAFMQLVEDGIEPPMTTADDVAIRYYRDRGLTVEADDEVMATVQKLSQAKAAKEMAAEEEKEHKLAIKKYMGDAAMLTYKGMPLVTWKSPKDSVSFDEKRFAEENPELYAKYQRAVPNARRMLLK